MCRECRRVPPDWAHPVDERGKFVPMHDWSFDVALACWLEDVDEWRSNNYDDDLHPGEPPRHSEYMPQWTPEQATHHMMYENTSAGTPISPAFATPEELARWLAANGASWFGGMLATYEQWLAVAQGGYGGIGVTRG